MLDDFLRRIPFPNPSETRPHITLSYAQSLDGSIATNSKQALSLSNLQSLQVTHRLRASHDAILIGIGTVLADDPQLTVRHAAGEDPQPIILDSNLRIPPAAKLFHHPKPPWIAVSNAVGHEQLDAPGNHAVLLPTAVAIGDLLDLADLLADVASRGISTILVEGGSRVISEFLRLQLVDAMVITITPYLIGGLQSVKNLDGSSIEHFPRLAEPRWEQLGDDRIVWGTPVWGAM
jgi:riboflavin-specific deaminase-like protein